MTETPTTPTTPTTPLARALQALVLTPETRAYLRTHDPKALQQACKALFQGGYDYLPWQGQQPSDLCWYCFLPLTRQSDGATVCRDCRHDGLPVQPQGWACDFCDKTDNPAGETHCGYCGSQR
jgi:hypothetical protein